MRPVKIPSVILNVTGIIIGACLLWACDSGPGESQGSDAKENAVKPALQFMDGSAGLPETGMWREGLALADLNGDGHMDIAAPPPRKAEEWPNKPAAWYGDGRGQWRQAKLQMPDIQYHYGDVAVADFTGDGKWDMALAMHGVPLTALKGLGQGRYADFSEGMPSGKLFLGRALASADINKDGRPDVVTLTEKANYTEWDGVWVCYYTDKKWACSPIGEGDKAAGLFGKRVTTGDVNGDGNPDIAVGAYSGNKSMIIWLGDGNGGFTPFNKGLPTHLIYASVTLVDIDGDGRDDLVTAISGFGKDAVCGLKVFLSREDGFEEMSDGLPQKTVMYAANAGDLDGDGRIEVIGGNIAGGLDVFYLNGKGWKKAPVSGLPEKGLSRIYSIYVQDMNGDGKEDLVVNYASERGGPSGKAGGGIRVFLNEHVK